MSIKRIQISSLLKMKMMLVTDIIYISIDIKINYWHLNSNMWLLFQISFFFISYESDSGTASFYSKGKIK